MNAVELHPAHVWDCPECGIENFCRGVVVELDEDGMRHMREEYGIEDAETGDFLMAPEEVVCANCDMTFATLDFREDER